MKIRNTVNGCENVDLVEFQNPSAFSKALREILRRIIIPLSDEENREAYNQQWDVASRNIELTVEGLAKLLARHPIFGAYAVGGVVNWLHDYFSAQQESVLKQRHLVYTEYDKKIPFRPEEDIMYVYMIAQIASIINKTCSRLSRQEFKHLVETFQEANDIAVDVFKQYPTTMPRFTDHKRLSLKVVQKLDKPINCCPSLHIGYSMLLDNVARIMILPQNPGVFEALRYSTLRMFNSVLYTGQHSIIDVAFGMVLARKVFESAYNTNYHDLTDAFGAMHQQQPSIDYKEIQRIYEYGAAASGSLTDIVGEYLAANGYAKVNPDEDINGCYFDTQRKEIVKIVAQEADL
ncbi:hypothetical protein HZB03_03850 [Candidatus Woesearchaeota archaeon]|nr:hypothetical protein [Candidatus Woesearchaeota archaeon]